MCLCWYGDVHKLVQVWRERVRGTERSRVVSDAVATLVLGLLLLALGLVGIWSGGPGADRWWFVLTLVVMCSVMLGKGRRPLLALGAGVVVLAVDIGLGGSMGVLFGLLDLIYSAALRASAAAVRRLELGAAVGVAGAAAAAFFVTSDVRVAANIALLAFALLITPLWWARSVRQQTELAALASARARDLARIGELREQKVVQAERTRMAGDLHDALASHLSAIAIHAEGALVAPGAARQDRTVHRDRQALVAIRSSAVAALREMRAMIDLLRTGDEGPTSPARLSELDALVARFRGQGMELAVAARPGSSELPAAVDQAAYRIVQESLTNALKHGRHGPVEVTLAVENETLGIDVSNPASPGNGEGAQSPLPGGGVGLLTMRERAEALGGTFAAGRQHECWRVHATIPLQETP